MQTTRVKKAILETLPADSHRRLQYRALPFVALLALMPAQAQQKPETAVSTAPVAASTPLPEALITPVNTSVLETTTVKTITATNLMHPQEAVFTSGQPTSEEFQAMAEAGIKHIINLRPDAEMNWDERQYVESLGMSYAQLPVASVADLTEGNAAALDKLLQQAGGEPVLVHCASGNRIGAVIAVGEARLKHKDLEEAIAIGKQWGLTKLEPQVRELLSAQ